MAYKNQPNPQARRMAAQRSRKGQGATPPTATPPARKTSTNPYTLLNETLSGKKRR